MMAQALLPIKTGSEKLIYESLGFVFKGTDGRYLYIATLPEGWHMRKSLERKESTIIYDRLARPRVEIDSNECRLICRFTIKHGTRGSRNVYSVYDEAEYMSLIVSDPYDPGNAQLADKRLKFVMECLKHLYPRHEDPLAYW